MAWNGSARKQGTCGTGTPHRMSPRRGRATRWLPWGVAALFLGGAVAWLSCRDDRGADSLKSADKDASRLVAAAAPRLLESDGPASSPAPRADGKGEWTSEAPARKGKATWSQLYGRGVAVTNDFTGGKSRYEISKRRSENELLFLTCAPVGTTIIGNTDYDDAFVADLKAALNEETTIDPEDGEERVALKRQLAAVKKELRHLLAQGGDLAEILSQTRAELQDLGVYKSQLEQQIVEFQNEGDEKTDEDVEAFVMAANLMLEEKGIEPFHFNAVTKEILKHKPVGINMEEER